MIRRHFLAGTSALSLGACAGGIPTSSAVATIAADAQIVAAAVLNVLAALRKANVPGLGVGTLASIQDAVAGAQGVAAAIGEAAPGSDPKDLAGHVGQLAGYLNAIIGAVSVLAIVPGPVAAYLTAASIVIPVLTATVQITVNMLKPPPSPVPIPTVDAARAVATTPAT